MSVSYEDIKKYAKIIKNDENQSYPYILLYRKWRFFYSTLGDTSPVDISDSNNSGIPDYIEKLLYKFETAKILLEESFGLRDPLKGGYFYEKGAKFIDIYLDNIPREHGIASGLVYDDSIKALIGTGYEGKTLRITVHKNLIAKTATPIHELFHIFQYSYVHFNNMWFMEGLARWSQSIMQEITGKMEELPQNEKELDSLVHKKHDAEFFWNRLITLCEDKDSFEIPESLENNSEIYNNRKTGSSFMKLFLENCEKEYLFMKKNLISRKLDDIDYIKRHEKRSMNNNQYIFKAIINTVNSLRKEKTKELENFINLITPLANIEPKDYNKKDIQEFFKVVKKYIPEVVIEKDEILYSEYYDIFTGTFSYLKFDFSDSLISDEELYSFRILRRFNGDLIFKNCKKLTTLGGLVNLVQVEGDLVLTNTNFEKLSELNNLVSVNSLKIDFMDKLTSINGLNELENIKSNLIISNNKNLTSIKGFNSLLSVTNIEILKTKLIECDFLSNFFKNNPIFKGSIKICDNQLENVKFFKGLKTIGSSLFLHQNKIETLEGLESLESVGASVSLSTNRLTNLKGLISLRKINGLLALSYNNLTSLDGLENLTSIKTKKWGKIYFTLKFYGNPNLKDISALKDLQTSDNYMVIYFDKTQKFDKKPDSNSAFHKNILELRDHKTNSLVPTYKFVKKDKHDYEKFRLATHNKTLTMLFDFEIETAEILVLSFTGAYGNLGGLFYNKYPLITENINTHKVFIMDPNHFWYNGGFYPYTKNMDENIAFIKKLILSKKYKKVVSMGTSMGAYLSLVLGCCIEELDEVLAFSPQTFLDSENREKNGETRWESLVKKFPKNIPSHYLDLNLLFKEFKNRTTKFKIHYGEKSKLDLAHIKNLPRQENIELVPYDVDDHYITVMLHKQERLNPIILESLKVSNKEKIKFSVIVTAFNIEELIEKSLQSVVEQTYDNFEIIVIDDGSKDNSFKTAENFLKDVKNSKIIQQENRGPGGARNRGIKEANGDYIVFLDGDDWLENNALEIFESNIKDDLPDALFSNRKQFYEQNKSYKKELIYKETTKGAVSTERGLLNRFSIHGKTFKRSFLIKNNILFPEKIIWEDYPFSYNILAHADNIILIPDITYIFRKRYSENKSVTQRERLSKESIESRLKQIDLDLQIIYSSKLPEIFSSHNFYKNEFEMRLLLASLKYLLYEEDENVVTHAFSIYKEYVKKNRDIIFKNVSNDAKKIYNAIYNDDLAQTIIYIKEYLNA